MSEEGDFPKTDDNLAASTKRLADWTFSLQGVGADLKAIVGEFKAYWRSLGHTMAVAIGPDIAPASRVMSTVHPRNSPNESVHDNSAPVQTTRITLPKDARDLILATAMAACLLTIVILSFLLHDAYKDARTQVWVRQDKEEEKFQKFVAGPYAELAGEVRANQILFSKCKESK